MRKGNPTLERRLDFWRLRWRRRTESGWLATWIAPATPSPGLGCRKDSPLDGVGSAALMQGGAGEAGHSFRITAPAATN
jgi:hypothetical protein